MGEEVGNEEPFVSQQVAKQLKKNFSAKKVELLKTPAKIEESTIGKSEKWIKMSSKKRQKRSFER